MLAAGVVVAGVTLWPEPPPRNVPPEVPLRAYHVVYQVDVGGAATVEDHMVHRPYDGRTTTRKPTGEILSATLSNVDGVFTYRAEQQGWLRLDSARQRATGDYRPISPVHVALRLGRGHVMGARTIAGTRCTLVRLGSALATPEVFARPTKRDHADFCFDGHGILLSERWTYHGKIARTMRATQYEPSPAIAPDTFQAVPALPDLPIAQLQSASVPFGPDAERSFRVRLDAAEIGLTPDDGYVHISFAAGQGVTSAVGIKRFVHGLELVDVRQNTGTMPNNRDDLTLTLPRFGRARLHLDPFSSALYLRVDRDTWVMVRAGDVDLLKRVGRHLARADRSRPPATATSRPPTT
jgi:hypothetical protein